MDATSCAYPQFRSLVIDFVVAFFAARKAVCKGRVLTEVKLLGLQYITLIAAQICCVTVQASVETLPSVACSLTAWFC